MTAYTRDICKENFCTAIVAPTVVAHVISGATNHINISFGHQCFDQGALARADFPEKTKVYSVFARREFLEFGLGVADINAGGFSFV